MCHTSRQSSSTRLGSFTPWHASQKETWNLYAVVQMVFVDSYAWSNHELARSTVIFQTDLQRRQVLLTKRSPRNVKDVHAHHAPSAASRNVLLPKKEDDLCCLHKYEHAAEPQLEGVLLCERYCFHERSLMQEMERPYPLLGPFHSMKIRERFLIKWDQAPLSHLHGKSKAFQTALRLPSLLRFCCFLD